MATIVIEREGALVAASTDGVFCMTEIRILPPTPEDGYQRHREAGDTTMTLRLAWPVAEGDPAPKGMIGKCKLRLEIEQAD